MLSNVLFFLIIGRVVEETHGAKYVTLLWIVTTIFVGLILIFLSDGITIGGSGFAMSLLSVYTYDFYRRRDPQYRAGILLIVINIVMGLS